MHSVASAPGFNSITGGNGTVWLLTNESEESINLHPPRISTITTWPNHEIKGDF